MKELEDQVMLIKSMASYQGNKNTEYSKLTMFFKTCTSEIGKGKKRSRFISMFVPKDGFKR